MRLSDEQLAAVRQEGHCAILAGPGSGKTRVLTEKAVWLIKDRSVSASEIAAVTFTRDAAQTLRDRIANRCGKRAASAMTIGTFHSIAYEQLRRANRAMAIIEPARRVALIRQVREAFNRRFTYEQIEVMVEWAKAQDAPLDSADTDAHKVAQLYQSLLDRQNRTDFQDMIRRAVADMRSEMIAPLKVRWMLVDEFQDADPIQYAWTKLHADNGAMVVVVGDDDQSVYGWRNALGYEGFKRFQSELQPATRYLSTNYRSRPAVVATSSAVVKHNEGRIEKTINAAREGEGLVQLVMAENRDAEARAIVQWASKMTSDVGVLTRTNGYLDRIEKALALAGIPYRRLFGASVWSKRPLAGLLDLLGFVALKDTTALDRVGKVAGLQFGRWRSFAERNRLPSKASEFILSTERPHPPGWERFEAIYQFAERVQEWAEIAAIEPNFTAFAMAMWWTEHHEQRDREEILALARALSGIEGSLAERVEQLRNRILDAQRPECQDDRARVRLMTIHRSKGLEFEEVWLAGLCNKILPVVGADEEEERRLLYVAMTRAEHALVLSVPIDQSPSPFQEEIEAAGIAPVEIEG